MNDSKMRMSGEPQPSALTYVEQHRAQYGQLWYVFRRPWSNNLALEAAWAETHIVPANLTPDEMESIRQQLALMNLFNGHNLLNAPQPVTLQQQWELIPEAVSEVIRLLRRAAEHSELVGRTSK